MTGIREEYVSELSDARGLSTGYPTCVPAEELGEVVEHEMARLGWTRDTLSTRFAYIAGCNQVAAERRVYSTCIGYALLNDLAIADAMLLALDIHMDDTDLPVFPSNKKGADILIECYAEDWTDAEKKELRHCLLRFTHGYVTANLLLGEEESVRRAEGRKREREVARKRNSKTGRTRPELQKA